MEFEYRVVEKNDLLIISLKGKISKEGKEELQKCLTETQKFEQKIVVLLMKDVTDVEKIMSRDLTIFQQELRTRNKNIFLVGMKMNLRLDLDNRGLIRAHEVKNFVEDIKL